MSLGPKLQKQLNVHVMHFVIASILIYIGIKRLSTGKVNEFWFAVLLILGFGALGYHGYRYLTLGRQ